MSIRESLQEEHSDTPLLFMTEVEYDDAIIGVIEGKAHCPTIAYDYERVIDINVEMGMNYEEALEYFDYNQIDAYMGENTPVFIRAVENYRRH